MQKDFDTWNTEKKYIDQKKTNKNLFFHCREIWWCSAGLNIGVETNGKHSNFERPMLILKKFNNEMIWVLPLTTKHKQNKYHYKITHQSIKSWVVLSQIKTLSTKRLIRKIDSVSENDFQNIIKILQSILV